MLAISLRASRQSAARAVSQRLFCRTLLTPTAVRQDMIQDMYVKELRGYKVPPVKHSDAEGHVQKFSMPKPPTSPEEADLTKDLQAYESQVPEVEGQAADGSSSAVEHDWFEEPEEDDAEGEHH